MAKIVEIIDDFKVIREILDRKKVYINIYIHHLNVWKMITEDELV